MSAAMDIVERLRFDSARCEMQFSKGVAGNIEEAAAEIKQLRTTLRELAISADTAEPLLRKDFPAEARSLYWKVAAAREVLGE